VATGFPSNLDKLIRELASAVHPGRDGTPFDRAVLLEDLELANLDQPEVVVDEVRRAVRAHLEWLSEERPTFAERVCRALRERASFHLAVPMVESWFFADPGGLARAGVPAVRLPPCVVAGDAEALRVLDTEYLADDGMGCSRWRSLPPDRQRDYRPVWLIARDWRERHPKAYLSWLCRDPAERRCTAYREVDGGRVALEGLEWADALRVAEHCRYLRSLVCDLAESLEVVLPFTCGELAGLTSPHHLPQDPVLRNI
jgi:hypothetical protein